MIRPGVHRSAVSRLLERERTLSHLDRRPRSHGGAGWSVLVAAIIVVSVGAYLAPGPTLAQTGPTVRAPDTVAIHRTASLDPGPLGALTAYVPIQLTDGGSAVPAGSQLLLNISTGGYSTLLNSNLSNVVFLYQNLTPIDAWLQNYTSGSSGVAQVWLNLSAPIPAGGSPTILLGILPLTANDFSTTGPWGEAPNLAGNDNGSADDGAVVFPAYINGETPLSDFTYLGTNLSTQSFGTSNFTAFNATQGSGPEAGFWYLAKNLTPGPLVVQAQFSSRSDLQGAGVAGLCTNFTGSPSAPDVTASIAFRYGFDGSAIYLSQSSGTSTLVATTPTGTSNDGWDYASLGYGGPTSLDFNGTVGSTAFGGTSQQLAFYGATDPFADPQTAPNLHVCAQTFTYGAPSAVWFAYVLARTPVPTAAALSVTYGPASTPSLTATPSVGGTGTTVDFNGSGFFANAALSTDWSAPGPTPVCPTTANASGDFSCDLTIGTQPVGSYAFTVSQAGGTLTAATSFAVEALSVTPQNATPLELVNFTGSGFLPGASLITNWSGWEYGAGPVCPASANASGGVQCSYLVGYLPAGSYVLNVTGSGSTLSGDVAIRPALTFTAPEGTPGTATSVQGVAFAASSPLTYTWPAGFPAVAGCSAVSAPNGNLSCPTFAIPPVPAGTYQLVVRDGSGNSANATIAVGTSLAANVSGVPVGESVLFLGAGFAGSHQVWVNWTAGVACVAETEENGSFTCAFTMPVVPGGAYPFTASDSVNSASTTVSVLQAIRASAPTLPSGAPLLVNVTGAPANDTVEIEYAPFVYSIVSPMFLTLCTGNTSISGAFSCNVTVPYTTGGYGYLVVDTSSGMSETLFTVGTQLTLLPASGPAGSSYVVNGTGWAYYQDIASSMRAQPVEVTWGAGGPVVCIAFPNAVGAFDCPAGVVPAQAAGPVRLIGTQTATVLLFTDTLPPAIAVANLTYAGVATFVVTTTLTAQITTGPGTPEAGVGVVFDGAASGGAGGYTYAWSFGDGGSASGPTTSHTYAFPGSYDVTLTVTDALGSTVTSIVTVVVAPSLSVGPITASPATIEVGQTLTFGGGATGGVGAFTYDWSGLPTGCSAGSVASFRCTPSTPGSFLVSLEVTDADHVSRVAPPLAIEVVPALSTPVVSSSASSVASGSSVSFGVSVSGGAGPYSYTWTGLPAGCAAANAPVITCEPSSTGSYSVAVTVTDAFGVVAQSTPVAVTVTSAASTASSLPPGLAYGQLALVALAVVLLVALLVLLLRAGRGGRPGTLNEYEEPTAPADGAGAKSPPQGSG